MKRLRLGTALLLIVIAALGLALVVQSRRTARMEAALREAANRARVEAEVAELRALILESEARNRASR